MAAFADILGSLVGGANRVVDKAVAKPVQQDGQQPARSFADFLSSLASPSANPQQVQQPAATQVVQPVQADYSQPVQQINETENSAKALDKQDKKEDKKKEGATKQAIANAVAGSLAGAAGPAMLMMPGLLPTEQAHAVEVEETEEAKPEVTTEGSQKNEAKGIGARLREAKKDPESAREKGLNENFTKTIADAPNTIVSGSTPEAAFGGYEIGSNVVPKIPDVNPDDLGMLYSYSPEAPFSSDMMPALSEQDIDNMIYGKMSSEDVEKIRKTVYPYGPDTKMASAKEPEDTWLTDAYGYLMSTPYDNSWDSMTGGTGYMRTTDGKWFDENLNLYDENPNPENKTTKQREQDNLENEMRMASEAQALLMENRGFAGAGGPNAGEHARLMSEGAYGKKGDEGYLSPEELEWMSDMELINQELAHNDKFRQDMIDKYGEAWSGNDGFGADYLRLTNPEDYSDKLDITKDLFLNEDMDPAVRAQLMQRLYNSGLDTKLEGDDLAQAIADIYFGNPFDIGQWYYGDKAYQQENAMTYDDVAASLANVAAQIPGGWNEFGNILAQSGLDMADIAAWAAAGNAAYRDNGIPLDYNSSNYEASVLADLLGDAGMLNTFGYDPVTSQLLADGKKKDVETKWNSSAKDRDYSMQELNNILAGYFGEGKMPSTIEQGEGYKSPVDADMDDYIAQLLEGRTGRNINKKQSETQEE